MIRKIIAALLLTFPVYAVVGGSDLVTYWFTYGNGWETFEPLFRLLQGAGVSRRAPLLYGVMLVLSFVLSLILIFGGSLLMRKKYGSR